MANCNSYQQHNTVVENAVEAPKDVVKDTIQYEGQLSIRVKQFIILSSILGVGAYGGYKYGKMKSFGEGYKEIARMEVQPYIQSLVDRINFLQGRGVSPPLQGAQE